MIKIKINNFKKNVKMKKSKFKIMKKWFVE